MKVKKFWIAVLVLSIIAIIALLAPTLVIEYGFRMPFITINYQQFICYGIHLKGYNEQWGFMLLTDVLMMVPARTAYLAMVKLFEPNKPNSNSNFIGHDVGMTSEEIDEI